MIVCFIIINFLIVIISILHTNCGEPEVPYNGRVINLSNRYTSDGFIPGTEFEYYCNSGPILFGYQKRRCLPINATLYTKLVNI